MHLDTPKETCSPSHWTAGGYGIGIAVRLNGDGAVLGYFFGPRRTSIPHLKDADKAAKEDAIYIKRFGDLGLQAGTWPIIGRLPGWRREEFPVPPFRQKALLLDGYIIIRYDPENIGAEISRSKVTRTGWEDLPDSGLSGYRAIEIVLSKMLSPEDGVDYKKQSPEAAKQALSEHQSAWQRSGVILHIPDSAVDGNEVALDEIEDALINALRSAEVGDLDGNELGGGEAVLFMYGLDADELLATIRETLRNAPIPSGTYAITGYAGMEGPGERTELA